MALHINDLLAAPLQMSFVDIDTGDLGADRAIVAGVEGAWVRNSFSLQGEYFHSSVLAGDRGSVDFSGFYLFGSWFLTGETRPYNKAKGVFGRVQPNRDFSLRKGGKGAWEGALRLSRLDLSSGAVRGGRMTNASGALNWYWSRNLVLRFNYVFSHVDESENPGNVHILQTRLQYFF